MRSRRKRKAVKQDNGNRFNYVVIIDSIPIGEYNTAKRLHEDLVTTKTAFEDTPGVAYVRIENLKQLTDIFYDLQKKCKIDGLLPLLHFELHGGENGIQLADGTLISWELVNIEFTKINKLMKLNLMVVFACCYGGTFIQSITLSKPAPVWGLIGPEEEISAGNLEADFGSFYRTLYSTRSPSKAIEVLNKETSQTPYYRTTAEQFFYRVWKSYKKLEFTESKMDGRLIRLREQIKLARPMIPPPSVSELDSVLREQEPQNFETFRNTYFMYEEFPENRKRFKVTYEKAESYEK